MSDEIDIVDELRDVRPPRNTYMEHDYTDLGRRSADEIERLRRLVDRRNAKVVERNAEIERLRAQLAQPVPEQQANYVGWLEAEIDRLQDQLRRAIGTE